MSRCMAAMLAGKIAVFAEAMQGYARDAKIAWPLCSEVCASPSLKAEGCNQSAPVEEAAYVKGCSP